MTKEPETPHKISFESFTLSFMKEEIDGSTEEDGEELSSAEAFDRMKGSLPPAAQFLGRVDDEVENFTSWKIEDHYFLLPWECPEFDYALIRITWDDNWGRYEWASDVRGSGFSDSKEAARVMVAAMFESWSFDLNSDEFEIYRDFLKKL